MYLAVCPPQLTFDAIRHRMNVSKAVMPAINAAMFVYDTKFVFRRYRARHEWPYTNLEFREMRGRQW